jgi:hypothetical protein
MPTVEKKARPALQSRAEVWDIPTWCGQLGIGRSTFYSLKVKPRTVYLGKLCKIIEDPAAYARRVAALQEQGAQAAA